MTSFLGIGCTPRQSTLSFKSIGQSFRVGQKVSDVTPSFKFASKMDSDVFFLYPASFIASVYEKRPILAGLGIGSTLKKITGKFDPPVVLAFGAKSRMDRTTIEELGLIEGPGVGTMKYGYSTRERLTLEKAKIVFGQLDFSNCSADTGFRSKGLCKQAIEVMTTLDRIATGYLISIVDQGVLEYRDSMENPDDGWTVSNVKVSIDDREDVVFKGGNVTIGTEFAENHNLEDNDAPVVTYLSIKDVNKILILGPGSLSLSYGHAFRFVPGTTPADGDFFGDLVLRHFSDFFDTASKALAVRQAISRHIPAIRAAGVQAEELLFSLIMIGCSIDAGCKVRLIGEGGRILGAVVQSNDPMLHGGNLVQSLEGDLLMSAVDSWTTSSKARVIISSNLSQLPLKNGMAKIPVNPESIATAHALLSAIAFRRKMVTFSDEFLNALPFLGYDFEALPATSSNITSTLKAISEDRENENVFWCKEIFSYESVVVSSNLSTFGISSISFLNPNGAFVNIYSSAKDDPKSKEKKEKVIEAIGSGKKGKKRVIEIKKETVKFWDRITVSRVSMEIAVRDFGEFLDTSRIRQIVGYDSRILGTVDVHPLDDDNSLLMALRLFGRSFEEVEKKAMVIREGGEGGVSLKRTKVDMSLGMEL